MGTLEPKPKKLPFQLARVSPFLSLSLSLSIQFRSWNWIDALWWHSGWEQYIHERLLGFEHEKHFEWNGRSPLNSFIDWCRIHSFRFALFSFGHSTSRFHRIKSKQKITFLGQKVQQKLRCYLFVCVYVEIVYLSLSFSSSPMAQNCRCMVCGYICRRVFRPKKRTISDYIYRMNEWNGMGNEHYRTYIRY